MKSRSLFFTSPTVATALLAVAAGVLPAGEPPSISGAKSTATKAPSELDKLWNLAVLYKNKDNPWLQEISLFGRINVNWANVDTDAGDWSDWEARRVRAGVKVKFLQSLELKTEVRFLPFEDEIYDGLTEASLTWTASPAFRLGIGKQLPRYLLEGAISANELLTVERSHLAGTFWVGEDNFSTGVTAAGDIGKWSYSAGIYSAENDKQWGKLNAGFYGVASLAYDFGEALHLEKAVVRGDFAYNNGDTANTTPKPFEQVYALGLDAKQGRFGLQTNAAFGTGLRSQPDVWGLVIMPSYRLSDQWELVTRYTFLHSEGADGLKPVRRYENEVDDINGTKGDQYQAIYAGLNHYLYGNKLKIQAGVEYSWMEDKADNGGKYAGWSFLTGFRFYF